MELEFNWKVFQSCFYPQANKKQSPTLLNESSPVFCIVNGRRVIGFLADGENIKEIIGLDIKEVVSSLKRKEIYFLKKELMEEFFDKQRLNISFGSTAHEAFSLLKEEIIKSKKIFKLDNELGTLVDAEEALFKDLRREHFLLLFFKSIWAKLLPRRFGFLLQLRGGQQKELFIVINHGKVEQCLIPQFSNLRTESAGELEIKVRSLTEKNVLPVIGVSLGQEEWRNWSGSSNPWRDIFAAIRKKQIKFYKFPWKTLILLKFYIWSGSFNNNGTRSA